MLAINLNSVIINTASPTAIQEQRQLGRDRFVAGEPISACQNAHQRSGYYTALVIAADCSTYEYLAAVRS